MREIRSSTKARLPRADLTHGIGVHLLGCDDGERQWRGNTLTGGPGRSFLWRRLTTKFGMVQSEVKVCHCLAALQNPQHFIATVRVANQDTPHCTGSPSADPKLIAACGVSQREAAPVGEIV